MKNNGLVNNTDGPAVPPQVQDSNSNEEQQFVQSYFDSVKELENYSSCDDDNKRHEILHKIADRMNLGLARYLAALNIKQKDLFNKDNDEKFNIISQALQEQNISLEREEDGSFSINLNTGKDDGNNFSITYSYNASKGEMTATAKDNTQKTVQSTEEDKKKKNQWFIIFVLVVSLLCIAAAIVGIVMYQRQQKEKKEQEATDAAKQDLQNGERVDTKDAKNAGTYKASENNTAVDADGKEIKLSVDTVCNEGELSETAKKAMYIENHPNAWYKVDGRVAINPRIDPDGTMKYYDMLQGKEILVKASDVKSFTANDVEVGRDVMDAMASYTRNSDGTITFNNTDAIIKFGKDNKQMTYSLYTDNGNLLSTYTKDNVFRNSNGQYGYMENGQNMFFSDNIQEALEKAFQQIENKYPDYNLDNIVPQKSI